MITRLLSKTATSKPFSLWPFGLYVVSGSSMEPALSHGHLVVGWKWFRPQVGQIVVVRTVSRPLIKRIVSIQGEKVWLEGDNKGQSTDSRQLGHFLLVDIEARQVLKI